MTSEEEEEIDSVIGATVAGFGFSPTEHQWMIIFSNGKKMIFSSGEDPYYQLTNETIN